MVRGKKEDMVDYKKSEFLVLFALRAAKSVDMTE
jgi:hypothetical protein